MRFLSNDASSAQLPDDTPVDRPVRESDGRGVISYKVGSDSTIELALNQVNHKYAIPVDQEDELARLIFKYAQTRRQLEKAYGRWQASRAKATHELEFMLEAQEVELWSFQEFMTAHLTATNLLAHFLKHQKTRGERRIPPWREGLRQAEVD